MSTGNRVKHYRKALNWTLERLSDKSGVEIGTLSAIERRKSQRSKFFPQIAKAFGLTVEQLLDADRDWTLHPPVPGTDELESFVAEAGRVLRSIAPQQRSEVLAFLNWQASRELSDTAQHQRPLEPSRAEPSRAEPSRARDLSEAERRMWQDHMNSTADDVYRRLGQRRVPDKNNN